MSRNAADVSRRKFLKAGAVAGAAATLAAPSIVKAQGVTSMRWQSTWPSKDIFHEYALDFAKKVNDMTGGELKIEVLPAGAVVPAFGLLEAVSKGTLDGGHGVLVYHYGKQTALALWGSGPAFSFRASWWTGSVAALSIPPRVRAIAARRRTAGLGRARGPAQTPFVIARGDPIVGFLFVDLKPRPRGARAHNKILWHIKRDRSGDPLIVRAHRDGSDHTRTWSWPATASPGKIYPSYLDVRQAGCWHVELRWGDDHGSVVFEIPTP